MRFVNTGMYRHVAGIDRNTNGLLIEQLEVTVPGHRPGTAIVNFPGHAFLAVVEKGASVDLPDDLSIEAVQRACPSLVPEENKPVPQAKPAEPKPPAKVKKE